MTSQTGYGDCSRTRLDLDALDELWLVFDRHVFTGHVSRSKDDYGHHI